MVTTSVLGMVDSRHALFAANGAEKVAEPTDLEGAAPSIGCR